MLTRAGLLVGLVIALSIVGLPVSPIQPTYATSDSMAPAITSGDVYFVVESESYAVGDVVTFYSTAQGGYVTHRIVGREADGFVTRGDANPTTDQAAGHPPVDPSAVVGSVVAIGGTPLTIPGLGGLLALLTENRIAVLWVAGGLVVLPELRNVLGGAARSAREERILRVRDVVVPAFVLLLLASLLLMAWGVSTHEMTWVAVSGGEMGSAHTVPVGEPATRTITVDVEGPSVSTVFVETEGLSVLDRTRSASRTELQVRVPPRETIGPYQTRTYIYAYPPTLPRGVLSALHDVHWLAAAAGTLVPVFVPTWLLYALLIDGRVPIRPSRRRLLRRLGVRRS